MASPCAEASVSFQYGTDGRDDLDDSVTVEIDVSYTKKISGNVVLELTGNGKIKFPCEVGQCRLPVSKPELEARLVSVISA